MLMSLSVPRGLRAPRVRAPRLGRSETGQTLVLFALFIIVLLGMIAIGLDGGRLYDERRRAQNAADHAATTAAHAVCELGQSTAAGSAAGLASANENGYNNNGSTNTVTVIHDASTDDRFTATIETTIPTTFAQVIGFANLDTGATATAECQDEPGGSGPGAIYAGGTSCGGGSSLRNVEISGNDHIVNGLTRSNGSFYNGGSGSDFINTPPDPSVEYVGTFYGGGPSNTYTAPAEDIGPAVPSPQWPSGWSPADQTSSMWTAYANARVNSNATTDKFQITTNGVYYTDRSGGVEIENVSAGVTTFVVINRSGPIKIAIDLTGRTFTAHANPAGTPENVIAVSGFTHSQNCDQFAIEKSGARGTFNGIFWAPRAMVRWSGNEATLNGAVIAHAFQMNGNDHRINYDPLLFPPEPVVVLLQ
jgi:Flp pilus assembly protein TadG